MNLKEYKKIDDKSNLMIGDSIQKISDADINGMLVFWREITLNKRFWEEQEKVIRDKVKAYLKEKKWTRYMDEDTKISANLFKVQTESFDKLQLRIMLTASQYQQVTKITETEKLILLLPETRDKLKQFIKRRKS